MMQVRLVADQHVSWEIGKGEVNFWNDRWLGDLRLADLVTPPPNLASFSVKQVLLNENEALTQCQTILPSLIQRKLGE